jgi:hypothetical protein
MIWIPEGHELSFERLTDLLNSRPRPCHCADAPTIDQKSLAGTLFDEVRMTSIQKAICSATQKQAEATRSKSSESPILSGKQAEPETHLGACVFHGTWVRSCIPFDSLRAEQEINALHGEYHL